MEELRQMTTRDLLMDDWKPSIKPDFEYPIDWTLRINELKLQLMEAVFGLQETIEVIHLTIEKYKLCLDHPVIEMFKARQRVCLFAFFLDVNQTKIELARYLRIFYDMFKIVCDRDRDGLDEVTRELICDPTSSMLDQIIRVLDFLRTLSKEFPESLVL